MKKIAFASSILLTVVMPLISLAHPGHGETEGYTIIHYFVEPVHAVVTFGVLIIAIAYIRYSHRKKA
jgi:hypothetical protein